MKSLNKDIYKNPNPKHYMLSKKFSNKFLLDDLKFNKEISIVNSNRKIFTKKQKNYKGRKKPDKVRKKEVLEQLKNESKEETLYDFDDYGDKFLSDSMKELIREQEVEDLEEKKFVKDLESMFENDDEEVNDETETEFKKYKEKKDDSMYASFYMDLPFELKGKKFFTCIYCTKKYSNWISHKKRCKEYKLIS